MDGAEKREQSICVWIIPGSQARDFWPSPKDNMLLRAVWKGINMSNNHILLKLKAICKDPGGTCVKKHNYARKQPNTNGVVGGRDQSASEGNGKLDQQRNTYYYEETQDIFGYKLIWYVWL